MVEEALILSIEREIVERTSSGPSKPPKAHDGDPSPLRLQTRSHETRSRREVHFQLYRGGFHQLLRVEIQKGGM